eukprot:7377505-Prymnesium_polylepis.1
MPARSSNGRKASHTERGAHLFIRICIKIREEVRLEQRVIPLAGVVRFDLLVVPRDVLIDRAAWAFVTHYTHVHAYAITDGTGC